MHLRETIRNEISSLISSVSGITTYSVQRFKPFNNDELPAQNILTLNESVIYDEGAAMGDRITYRTLNTVIEYQNKNTDASLIDDWCEQIENEVLSNAKTSKNYIDIELELTSYKFDTDGNEQLISCEMLFRVIYRLTDGVSNSPA